MCQAAMFLCLNFNGVLTKYNELPINQDCLSGIQLQINFSSCWDRKNIDSEDHKSYVTFPLMGLDNGMCDDLIYPVTIPQIFMEVCTPPSFLHLLHNLKPHRYTGFSNGDPMGYGYHTNLFNGWESGILQRAINECHCNLYGDPLCCVVAGVFTIDQTMRCLI
ncbi:hypothetical protein EDD18DRAFT_1087950 [Armillaria luteobubalina]|uniref:DUF1996 domain-containing protein n=1 Tax=Armillaria luteobubalina TaxID=153913 RepID=A0AA39P410_9AGAR|nr:hypothetical protein EDD18DRAFT_1087950 [Armillaria luteobubalina]